MLPVVIVGIYLLGAAFAAPAPLPDEESTHTLPNGAVVHHIKRTAIPGQQIQLPGGGGQIVMNGQPGQPQRIVVHRTVQSGQPIQMNGQPIQMNGQPIQFNGQPIQMNGQPGQPQVIVHHVTQNGQPGQGGQGGGQSGQPGQPQVIVRHITQNGPTGQAPPPPTGAAPPQVVIHQQIAPQPPTAKAIPPQGQPEVQVININQHDDIKNKLGSLPNVQINDGPEGQTATAPANVIYQFLQDQGVPLPDDPTFLANSDPIIIYIDEIWDMLDNKDKYANMTPQQIINILIHDTGAPLPDAAPKGRGPLTPEEILLIIETLSKNPSVKITRRPKPKGDIATLPAKVLYEFLLEENFPWPADMSTVPGFQGDDALKLIIIYLDQLYYIIEKFDTVSPMPPLVILKILMTNPWGYVEIDDAAPVADAGAAAGDGDNSYLANTGINRRQKCGRGLVDEAAEGIRSGVNGLVGSVATALGSGVLGAVGHGASALITHAISGVDFAIQDAACGLGNIADELAEALDTGDILGGVGKIGQEFLGGVANMAEDLVSEAGAGVGQAAGNIFGFLQDLGK